MHLWRCAFCFVGTLVVLPQLDIHAAQSRHRLETAPSEYVPHLMEWIEQHYEIAKAYQRGEIDFALRQLSERNIAEERQIASRIMGILNVKLTEPKSGRGDFGDQVDASRRRPGIPFTQPGQNQRPAQSGAVMPMPSSGEKAAPRFDWTLPMMKVAGALHMDAALQAYRHDDASSARDLGEQIKIAEAYFEFYELSTGEETDSRRWQLAIGLTAMKEARFGLAMMILDDACTTFPADRPLQLACGSIHEVVAMMPADVSFNLRLQASRPPEDNPLTEFDESNAARYRASSNALGEARSAREAHLKRSARALELAVLGDRDDAEAALRLAHVRMLQGDHQAAVRLLEPLLARVPAGPSPIAYLARLYLGELLARQRQPGRAAALFEEAITLMPAGQSAYMALADLARTAGRRDDAMAVLHRMLSATAGAVDPWIAYRFGQYQVPAPLIAELRTKAQQQ